MALPRLQRRLAEKLPALAVVLLALACAAALHAYPIVRPWLFDDDFAILAASRSWESTRANLWQPWNDHAMPLGRLTTWVLMNSVGALTDLPRAAAFQGPVAALGCMILVYVFVRREMGHAFYGLAALVLFGVSLKYNEAVRWFAASFAVLALDTLLLALLAAQRWRQTGGISWLLACAAFCGLAPGWFAAGILAGPFCTVYLLSRPGAEKGLLYRSFAAAAPLTGTAAFIALAAILSGPAVGHARHYGGQSALAIFNPIAGLELTGRIVVDNLVLGFQAVGRTCPRGLAPAIELAMLVVAYLWSRQRRAQGTVMLLGASFILLSYWLVYSFRWPWPYESMMVGWTRYNLVPYLGLVLIVVGGLPSREGSLFVLRHPAQLTARQAWGLSGLALLMLALQLPGAVVGHARTGKDPAPQQAALRKIEELSAFCRQHAIAADQALLALPPLNIPYSGDPEPQVNGWIFLRGSSSPMRRPTEAVRSLLQSLPPDARIAAATAKALP